jgi:hypothetical protein
MCVVCLLCRVSRLKWPSGCNPPPADHNPHNIGLTRLIAAAPACRTLGKLVRQIEVETPIGQPSNHQ